MTEEQIAALMAEAALIRAAVVSVAAIAGRIADAAEAMAHSASQNTPPPIPPQRATAPSR